MALFDDVKRNYMEYMAGLRREAALIDKNSRIWNSLKSGVTGPRDAYMGNLGPRLLMDEYGRIYENPAYSMRALDTAMMGMGGGMLSSAARPIPKGSLASGAIKSKELPKPEGPFTDLTNPSKEAVEAYIRWANQQHLKEQAKNIKRRISMLGE